MRNKNLSPEIENLKREIEELRASISQSKSGPKFLSRTGWALGTMIAALVMGSVIYAVTVPNSFVNGTVIDAARVNTNFTTLATQITTNQSGIATNLASVNGRQVVFVKETQTEGTASGGLTAGVWQTRVLNTLENPFSYSWVTSPTGNSFSLTAGTYQIDASCPAFKVDRHKCKLFNTTDASDALLGTVTYSEQAPTAPSRSFINGTLVISATKSFEIRHISSTTRAGDGLGISGTTGWKAEVFTTVKIKRLSTP